MHNQSPLQGLLGEPRDDRLYMRLEGYFAKLNFCKGHRKSLQLRCCSIRSPSIAAQSHSNPPPLQTLLNAYNDPVNRAIQPTNLQYSYPIFPNTAALDRCHTILQPFSAHAPYTPLTILLSYHMLASLPPLL